MSEIRTVLLDIDGTIRVDGKITPAAAECVRWLVESGRSVRFISNATIRSRRQVAERLARSGLDLPTSWFFTPACAARAYFITRYEGTRVLPVVHPDLIEDLCGLTLVESAPADYVLAGDMHDAWDAQRLHSALRALLDGALLTALHLGRRWMFKDGWRLDAGAFVAALEYGAQTRCQMLFGKPGEWLFRAALDDAGGDPSSTLMVGDDYINDVEGAAACGIRSIQVRTGNFGQTTPKEGGPSPLALIDRIDDLPECIARTGR